MKKGEKSLRSSTEESPPLPPPEGAVGSHTDNTQGEGTRVFMSGEEHYCPPDLCEIAIKVGIP